jgi:hypothetical protein
MRSLHHFSRRHVGVVAGLLIGASSVACTDDVTAPRRAAGAIPPAGAQGTIILPRSLVSVRVEFGGQLLPEAARIRFVAGNDTAFVKDNTMNDKDPTLGIIKVSLPWSSSYQACLSADTPSYAIVPGWWACSTVAGNAAVVDAGILRMRRFPLAAFSTRDVNWNTITEAVFTLDADADGFFRTAEDGGPGEISPAVDGMIVIRGNRPGTYTWCETVAPAGYLKPSPSCGSIELEWDQTTSVVLQHAKKITIQPQF